VPETTSLPLRAEVECKSRRQVFVDILLAASGMLATDKRDHVFAFLSSSLAQHPDGKPFAEPDYTKDLRDIYFETASSILRHPREAPYFLSRVKASVARESGRHKAPTVATVVGRIH